MDLMDYRRKIIMSSPHLSHAEGAVASFSDGTDLPLKSLLVNIDPVQSGSGDPSPTNIRPISGWSAANVTGTGKNLFKPMLATKSGVTVSQNADGSINLNGTATSSYNFETANYKLKAGTYTLSCPYDGTLPNNSTRRVQVYPGGAIDCNQPSDKTVKFTLATDTAVSMRIRIDNGFTYNNVKLYPQIELGSTATPYEPYTGTSVTISLGQTVYGGTLNVLTGELVAYPYYASYNGETLTGRWVSDRDKYVAGTTPTIGAQVVDMSGTGTTYTLDPQTVRSLVGQNNIFADTGNIALEYWAHP